MTLDELDTALRAQGWARTDRRNWAKFRDDGAGMTVKLLHGGPEPWEWSVSEMDGWHRRTFATAKELWEAML